MRHALIKISGGIIDQVFFFEDPGSAIQALSKYVKNMNSENDDAALYDTEGLVANAKQFLDDQDMFIENEALIKEVSEKKPRPLFIIANPNHRLGFMVASPDDPLGYLDPAEAVSDLEQMRRDFGKHLKLYRVTPVEAPVLRKVDLEKRNADSDVEAFDDSLVEEYLI